MRPPEPGLALLLVAETGVDLEGDETLVRVGEGTSLQCHLGLPEAEPGPAASFGIDAVTQVTRVDAELIGDVFKGGFGRLAPTALHQR